MSERAKFVIMCLEQGRSIASLCREFGISRKTGYKWLERFQANSFEGLKDLPRATHHHPNQMSGAIREELLSGREVHPTWGPRKILAWLTRKKPELELPAASTVGELYRREGLSHPRRRRRKLLPVSSPMGLVDPKPNDLWAADFKGQFHTLDGSVVYPLTLTDHRSRYLLVCQSLDSVRAEGAWPFFERAFRI
jgi:transposase